MSDEEGAREEGPPVGTVLEGRYRLTEQIDRGGVGWVYRAEHLRLGTEVAIKMLQTMYEHHDMLRPRFEREARVLAELRHPNIVTLTDYSLTDKGRPYLVMELLEGQTLSERLQKSAIEEPRVRHILGQILDALIYAHDKGFAHRDLKPKNIFLVALPTDEDHVKVLDFGFVKLLRSDSKVTDERRRAHPLGDRVRHARATCVPSKRPERRPIRAPTSTPRASCCSR